MLKMCLDTYVHNHLDIMPLESIPVYHRRIHMSVGPTSRFLCWTRVTFISLCIRVFVCVCVYSARVFSCLAKTSTSIESS